MNKETLGTLKVRCRLLKKLNGTLETLETSYKICIDVIMYKETLETLETPSKTCRGKITYNIIHYYIIIYNYYFSNRFLVVLVVPRGKLWKPFTKLIEVRK